MWFKQCKIFQLENASRFSNDMLQEKMSLKDEITMTLLPRAFSKHSKIYGYIDVKHNWLIIGTSNTKKCEQFISLFKKSITEEIKELEVKNISYTLTQWVKNPNFSTRFAIEKACLLQDPEQQLRTIRCRHQDLLSPSIQGLLKDGCEIKQVALSWQDRTEFVLHEDLSLQGIKFQDEIKQQAADMDAESEQQQFDVDFLIMGDTLSALMTDLLSLFKPNKQENRSSMNQRVTEEIA